MNAASLPESLRDIDRFLEQELAQWQTPGLAVAVIADGKVIFSRGYGLRDREAGLPVTPKTVFPIASVTKSMTVSTLAALARRGKLDWDTPVREYMPDFRLYDPVATDRTTPRDLVTHRTGLPRHDFVWYNAPLTRDETYRRLRYLEPSKDFRSAYQYQNLMYMTAGYLAGRLEGATWEQVARRLLFAPLGMKRSSFTIAELEKSKDFARAYKKDDADAVHRVPYYVNDVLGPAGSVNSCVEDLIRYVAMHLDRGMVDGKPLLSEQDVNQMQTPQMVIPESLTYPEIGHSQYGMGFTITQYRGHKFVSHGGALDGFSTYLSFMPNAKLGVVALANLSGSALPVVAAYRIYDDLLGLEPVDWSDRFQALRAKGKAAESAAKERSLSPRKPDTHPSHPLEEYAGRFEHPAYGVVEIEAKDPALELRFHGFASPLNHFHYEVFETPADKLNHLERTRVAFDTDWNGDISSLRIAFEPQVADIVFKRAPDPAMQERAFLAPLAGAYAGAVTITVALEESGRLRMLIPGQTPYALLPVRGTTFALQGLSGTRVEFLRAEDGRVTGLALYQPNANLVFDRAETPAG